MCLSAYVASDQTSVTTESTRGVVNMHAVTPPPVNTPPLNKRKDTLMPLIRGQVLSGTTDRTYHVQVPATPPQATVPAIVVFHGGGQDVTEIARRWGVDPPNPVPTPLENYLLVFPEADRRLSDEWVHFQSGDSAFPTYDLEFVEALLAEITTRLYPTGLAGVDATADPDLVYAAGFSNGGGMVWQLANSDLVSRFQGFAVVGKALDPEKVEAYRKRLSSTGDQPAAIPVMYVHGTADHGYRPPFTLEEVALRTTLPAFTVQEMLDRNGIPTNAPAITRLIPGTTNLTEVVVQLYQGTEAFVQATVINGGHNWPGPTTRGNPPVATHFDATEAAVEFWRTHAGLPSTTFCSVPTSGAPDTPSRSTTTPPSRR
jgi:poly(3-hydroxybutyrate) depolymerase